MNTSIGKSSLRAFRPRQFPDRVRRGRHRDGDHVLARRLITSSQSPPSLGVETDWSFAETPLAVAPALKVTCVHGTTGPEIICARVPRKRRLLRAIEITLVNTALCDGEPEPTAGRYPLPGLGRPCKPGHPHLAPRFEEH